MFLKATFALQLLLFICLHIVLVKDDAQQIKLTKIELLKTVRNRTERWTLYRSQMVGILYTELIFFQWRNRIIVDKNVG